MKCSLKYILKFLRYYSYSLKVYTVVGLCIFISNNVFSCQESNQLSFSTFNSSYLNQNLNIPVSFIEENNSFGEKFALNSAINTSLKNSFFSTVNDLPPYNDKLKTKEHSNNTAWYAVPKPISFNTYSPYGNKGWPLIFIGTFIISILLVIQYYNQLQVNEKNLFKVHEATNEINRLKLHFFTTLNHDFRSPLTKILNPIEELLTVKNHDPNTYNKLKTIENNVKNLIGVVNQLTDYRKIEIEETKLVLAKTDVVDFIRDLTNSYQILAESKSIELSFKSRLLTSDIWFDGDKIEKAFNDLLFHLIDKTPNKGAVNVSTSIPSDFLKIKRKNREIECKYVLIQLEKITSEKHISNTNISPFNVVDEFKKKIDIVKNIMEIHSGSFAISEEKENCFLLKLPVGNAHLISGEIPDFSPIENEKINTNITSLRKDTSGQKTHLPSILISDSDSNVRKTIKKGLKDKYRIIETDTSKKALTMALKEIPNLVIGDVSNTDAGGIGLCYQLKNNIRTSHIPVILLSPLNSVQHRIEGFESGADAYIPKPIKMELLGLRVDKLIESRALIHRYFETQKHLNLDEIGLNSNERNFLDDIMSILEEHIEDESYGVDQLATDMNLSRSTLFRKLKNLTGHAPNEFIRMIRLKRAAQMLTQNQLTISEISYLVGFSDPNYFGKCFRKMFGESPSNFASKHKNASESPFKEYFTPTK